MNKQSTLDFIDAINTQHPEPMYSLMTYDQRIIDAHNSIVVGRRR